MTKIKGRISPQNFVHLKLESAAAHTYERERAAGNNGRREAINRSWLFVCWLLIVFTNESDVLLDYKLKRGRRTAAIAVVDRIRRCGSESWETLQKIDRGCQFKWVSI